MLPIDCAWLGVWGRAAIYGGPTADIGGVASVGRDDPARRKKFPRRTLAASVTLSAAKSLS